MEAYKFLVVLAALVVLSNATSIKFKDCGSKTGKISDVDGDPCPAEPCVIHKGTNVTMHVTFTTNIKTANASTVIHGIIAGIPAPFPSPCADCGCGLECPLKPNTTYVYTAALPVAKSYPSVDVIAKWELRDDNNSDIWCFEIPISIKP